MKTLFYIIVVILLLIFFQEMFDGCNSGSSGVKNTTEWKKSESEIKADSTERAKTDSINKLPLKEKMFTLAKEWEVFDKKLSISTTEQFFSSYTLKALLNCKVLAIAKDSLKIRDISTAYNRLKSIMTATNKRIYRSAREEFYKICKNDLWQEDIKVTLSKDTKTITFTGRHFSSNRRISDTYKQLENSFDRLRFKRVNFRYSDYGDYTYFPFNPPDDSVIPGCN